MIASNPALLHKLSRMPIFNGLAETALTEFLRLGWDSTAQKDAFFFLQGDPATHLYILSSGRVKLCKTNADGQQAIMGVIGAWQMFGGVAALANKVYPVSAQAVELSQAFRWGTDTLEDFLKRYPVIAINTVNLMAEHVQEAQNQYLHLATERVEQRLARVLVRLARQVGQKTPQGVLVDFPLSRQDLAEMSGTTLYTVSRILSQWEKQGLVETGRERVLIRYPHGLVMIAEDLESGSSQQDP
jgi:CRP-like cAMP-binding protein